MRHLVAVERLIFATIAAHPGMRRPEMARQEESEMRKSKGWTKQSWENREWVFRFDELRPYLASKESAAQGLNQVAKARPDEGIIAAAVLAGMIKRYPKGRRTLH